VAAVDMDRRGTRVEFNPSLKYAPALSGYKPPDFPPYFCMDGPFMERGGDHVDD
jgi:hypothetical protein